MRVRSPAVSGLGAAAQVKVRLFPLVVFAIYHNWCQQLVAQGVYIHFVQVFTFQWWGEIRAKMFTLCWQRSTKCSDLEFLMLSRNQTFLVGLGITHILCLVSRWHEHFTHAQELSFSGVGKDPVKGEWDSG